MSSSGFLSVILCKSQKGTVVHTEAWGCWCSVCGKERGVGLCILEVWTEGAVLRCEGGAIIIEIGMRSCLLRRVMICEDQSELRGNLPRAMSSG